MMYNFGIVDSRFNNNNGKIEYTPMTNNYKECLRFMKKLYSEGLLDNEFLTQTSQQMTAKGNEGCIGMFSATDAFLVVKTEDEENYKRLPPLHTSIKQYIGMPTMTMNGEKYDLTFLPELRRS